MQSNRPNASTLLPWIIFHITTGTQDHRNELLFLMSNFTLYSTVPCYTVPYCTTKTNKNNSGWNLSLVKWGLLFTKGKLLESFIHREYLVQGTTRQPIQEKKPSPNRTKHKKECSFTDIYVSENNLGSQLKTKLISHCGARLTRTRLDAPKDFAKYGWLSVCRGIFWATFWISKRL